MTTNQSLRARLKRFFVREDAVYDAYAAKYQARTPLTKAIYLLMYLLPGIVLYVAINVEPVFRWQLSVTGLSERWLQYAWSLVILLGWHLCTPFLVLRFADKLTFRESLAFLGVNRLDRKGFFVVLPVFFVLFALVSIPYLKFVWPPLETWAKSVALFRVPSYSIFGDTPEAMYSFPPLALVFLFIGNFLGEELYFRGYLMKKSEFLGSWNWVVNSLLMGLYHVWQVQQTWPLLFLALGFGLLMKLRKDLWVLVAFHFLVNMWLAFGVSFG
jgi:uncharacterized protein